MRKKTFINYFFIILFCILITFELLVIKNKNTLFSYLINLLFYFAIPYKFYQTLIYNKINYSIIILFILVIDLVSFNTKNEFSYLFSISSDILVFINIYLLYYVFSNIKTEEKYCLKNDITNVLEDLNITKLMYFKI